MAVAFDAKGSVTASNGLTSITDNSLTIGAGSNMALLWLFGISNGGPITFNTITWNGVALTAPSGASGNNASTVSAFIYGLIGPATGNHTFSATWTGSHDVYAIGASYSGVGSFAHGNGNTGSASPASVTVTSATGNMVAAVHAADGNWGSISGTTLFSSTALNKNAAANYDNGAASVSLTAAGVSSIFASAGVDLVAAGGATGGLRFNSSMDGLGASGGFFSNPLARSVLGWRPSIVTARCKLIVPRHAELRFAA